MKTSDYKRLSDVEAAKRILEIKNPEVLIHVRPDGDAVGTAAALCLIFGQLGAPAKILSQDKIPSRLGFILDYTGVALAEGDEKGAFSKVAVDVASPAQLGRLYDEGDLPILMIDHHKLGEQFADGYIAPTASSAAEALFEIARVLFDMGKIKLDEKLAFALYSAISSDTGRFSYSSTTPKTHRIAATLMECGIDASEINRRLFDSKSYGQVKAEGFIASKIKSLQNGEITYASLTLSELSELGVLAEEFETAIDVIRGIRGAKISFFVREVSVGEYRASLRSTEADVSLVAQRFGGGGHIKAAGCTVKADSIEAAIQLLLDEIKDT